LAKLFEMSEYFWVNLQLRWDLYKVKQAKADDLKTIKPSMQKTILVHA
jgi:plasmid maintenance system antidote protein VapI